MTDEDRARGIIAALCAEKPCAIIDERSCGCFRFLMAAFAAVRAVGAEDETGVTLQICFDRVVRQRDEALAECERLRLDLDQALRKSAGYLEAARDLLAEARAYLRSRR